MSYKFYQLDRVADDSVFKTQNTLQNTRYANYNTANFFNEFPSDTQIQFATAQPIVIPNSTYFGSGVGTNVDTDSILKLNSEQERSLGRLSLLERPYLTVPYLGRGSSNPVLEAQLQQGETVRDMKSASTIMDKSFVEYSNYPLMDSVKDRITNPNYSVEEAALDGWVRGGLPSREVANDTTYYKK